MKTVRVTLGDLALAFAAIALLAALIPFASQHPFFAPPPPIVSDSVERLAMGARARSADALAAQSAADAVDRPSPSKAEDHPAVQRPLFTATRRPPPKPVVRKPPPRKPPPPKPKRPPGFVLSGVLSVGDERVAVIKEGAKTQRLRIDDERAGWRIVRIEESTVTMIRGETEIAVDRKGSRFTDP